MLPILEICSFPLFTAFSLKGKTCASVIFASKNIVIKSTKYHAWYWQTTNVESSSIRRSRVRLSLLTADKKYFPNFFNETTSCKTTNAELGLATTTFCQQKAPYRRHKVRSHVSMEHNLWHVNRVCWNCTLSKALYETRSILFST